MTYSTLLAAEIPLLLRRLLGIPSDSAGTERARLVFAAGMPVLALVLVLLSAAAWFVLIYRRDGTASWWFKATMSALRLLAFAALMTILAQPVLRLRHVESIRPAVAVLVDTSQSMAEPDRRLGSTLVRTEAEATGIARDKMAATPRLDRAVALINHSGLLAELAKRYSVRLYTFAGAPRTVSLPSDHGAGSKLALTPDAATGDSTQMGTALRRALDDLTGRPTAGALILSDGGNNMGEDPVAVADAARQARLPISTIGIGDPTKTKDIALLSVLADDVVRVNNTVTVYASLTHRGYAGRTIAVTLKRGGAAIETENVRLGPDEQKQEVRFSYVPTQAGRFYYSVTAAVQPDEVTAANNTRTFVQNVISKKLRILYVENEPRYEFRYLRNAVLRDTSLDFGCLLLSGDDVNAGGEGNLVLHGFPADEKALFEFDMVILGDVPRSFFSNAQIDALRRFVEDRGGSLIVIAGERHMPQEYAGTPLEAVLPVVISAAPNPLLTDDPFQWQLTPEGRRSAVMQLDDDPVQNAKIWQTLPGMYWSSGVPRARPGATVLAVHPTLHNSEGPYVLVATQPFGAGKCYIELVDSTYLWRKRVGDRYFYRYWGQVLRTLTPKELPGNSRFVQLNADRNAYRLGDKAALSARLLDAYYHPIKAATATAIVQGQGGATERVTLRAVPGSPGLYTAQYQPDRVGRYQVSLTSPANPEAKASAGFVVESLALEKQKPELDEALLKKVAAAGGGRYYAPNAVSEWIKSLSDNPLAVRSEQEIELWDTPLLLILFIVPLTAEWILRKRKGLL